VLYVHTSGERVRPAAGSPHEAQLAAKAADRGYGWSAVDESAPAPSPRSRAAVPAPTVEETS